jgi:hypothetical protein
LGSNLIPVLSHTNHDQPSLEQASLLVMMLPIFIPLLMIAAVYPKNSRTRFLEPAHTFR